MTKRKKEEIAAPKEVESSLTKGDFKHIKFTHSQVQFFKTIKNNFLTVCTGPAGCLTKNEKIRVYIMKSKIISRNVQDQSCSDSTV